LRLVADVAELRTALKEKDVALFFCAGQPVVVVPPHGKPRKPAAIVMEVGPDNALRWSANSFSMADLRGGRFVGVLASHWVKLDYEAKKAS
jgi:hypothetical protein